MNDAQFMELTAWLTEAGLAGVSELAVVTGFCERAVAAGLPIARGYAFVDTLHPVHEGRVVRWGQDAGLPPEVEYGRSTPVAADEPPPNHDVWRSSPFFRMLETGKSLLRRRLLVADETEFTILPELRVSGFTDYVAIINRFASDAVIGEMDCVYSSWTTRDPNGFQNSHIEALQRLSPFFRSPSNPSHSPAPSGR